MSDKELFIECVNRINQKGFGIYMDGTMVMFGNDIMFNTDGHSLTYNLMRLGKVIETRVEF